MSPPFRIPPLHARAFTPLMQSPDISALSGRQRSFTSFTSINVRNTDYLMGPRKPIGRHE